MLSALSGLYQACIGSVSGLRHRICGGKFLPALQEMVISGILCLINDIFRVCNGDNVSILYLRGFLIMLY